MGNSIYCSLFPYFWVYSSCFCASDQPLWGWNNPVQQCLPVRESCHYPRRRQRGGLRTDWQTALMCNRRRPAAASSRRASFSALASANSFVYFASSAATSRWRICMSVIAAFASFSSLAFFVALGFVGNGGHHGNWLTAHDRQTMMRVARAEIIAVTLLIRSSCKPFSARFFEFCNQAVSLMLRTDHNQRPAVKPRYCCNGRLPDGPYRSIIGKAPRSSSAAMQRPDFSEESLSRPSCLQWASHQQERSW